MCVAKINYKRKRLSYATIGVDNFCEEITQKGG